MQTASATNPLRQSGPMALSECRPDMLGCNVRVTILVLLFHYGRLPRDEPGGVLDEVAGAAGSPPGYSLIIPDLP